MLSWELLATGTRKLGKGPKSCVQGPLVCRAFAQTRDSSVTPAATTWLLGGSFATGGRVWQDARQATLFVVSDPTSSPFPGYIDSTPKSAPRSSEFTETRAPPGAGRSGRAGQCSPLLSFLTIGFLVQVDGALGRQREPGERFL